MRKRNDLEPRLMALTEAELAAARRPQSWIPQVSDAALNTARSWQRARQPESLALWSTSRVIH